MSENSKEFIDTREADTFEWIARCAAMYVERGPKVSDEDESVFPDLRILIADGAVRGEVEAAHVAGSLADLLQAVCCHADGSVATLFTEVCAEGMASLMRANSPVRGVRGRMLNKVEIPVTRECDSADRAANLGEQMIDSASRLGAMVDNLWREPTGVDGEALTLREEWSIGAALQAVRGDDKELWVSTEEWAVLASLPLIALTEVLDWLDARVHPALSRSALDFLRSEVVPAMFDRVDEPPSASE
jgi:hypothetical protein